MHVWISVHMVDFHGNLKIRLQLPIQSESLNAMGVRLKDSTDNISQ